MGAQSVAVNSRVASSVPPNSRRSSLRRTRLAGATWGATRDENLGFTRAANCRGVVVAVAHSACVASMGRAGINGFSGGGDQVYLRCEVAFKLANFGCIVCGGRKLDWYGDHLGGFNVGVDSIPSAVSSDGKALNRFSDNRRITLSLPPSDF